MAPKTLATPIQSAKLLDINRDFWSGMTGIKIVPDLRPLRPENRHPKINADVGSKTGEDVEVFIADAWPLGSYEDQEAKERVRRETNGQGPLVSRLTFDKGQVVPIEILSPTKRHWKRSTRRSRARVQHLSRRLNWTRTRTTRTGGRKVVTA